MEKDRNSQNAVETANSGIAQPAQGTNDQVIEELRKEVLEVQTLLKQYQQRSDVAAPSFSTEEARKREYARDTRPVLSREQAIATVGALNWKKMSVEQRVAAQGFSAQDVSEHKIEKYFGPGSNSGAANKLAMSNPALYRVLKAKAKEEGLI